jgi:DNA-binding response OmpR family regulator
VYKILLIEDDCDIAEITNVHLAHSGYSTDTARSCADAAELLSQHDYDLILLDVLLPDGTGHDFCRVIRAKTQCPVIFMSCLDDSGTIISALNGGGDDYIVKPVKYDELLARIEANIRRSQQNQEERRKRDSVLREFRHFKVDKLHRRVLLDGGAADLSSIEYNLLMYMADHPDTLLLYDELYHHVWANDSLGDVRTVMVHISNLRKKIDPEKAGIIGTVRGAGYIFSDI